MESPVGTSIPRWAHQTPDPLPRGDGIQMGGSQVRLSQTTGWGHFWVVGPTETARGTRGNLPETGSCSTPSRPNAPEGAPAARLVPQWHVTNGNMFLLPCFVRLVALIEDNAEGIAQIHMSAARTPAHQKPRDGQMKIN